MTDQVDEGADPPYLVPTHLRQAQSIGPIPVRAFFVLLITGLLVGVPEAIVARRAFGDVGLWLGLVPVVLATHSRCRSWISRPSTARCSCSPTWRAC